VQLADKVVGLGPSLWPCQGRLDGGIDRPEGRSGCMERCWLWKG
jgi:hypothetical protein